MNVRNLHKILSTGAAFCVMVIVLSSCSPQFEDLEFKPTKVAITSDVQAEEALLSLFDCQLTLGGGFIKYGNDRAACSSGPSINFSATQEQFERTLCNRRESSAEDLTPRLWGSSWVLTFFAEGENELELGLAQLVYGGSIASARTYSHYICD